MRDEFVDFGCFRAFYFGGGKVHSYIEWMGVECVVFFCDFDGKLWVFDLLWKCRSVVLFSKEDHFLLNL